jgi:chromosome segregation ATPase
MSKEKPSWVETILQPLATIATIVAASVFGWWTLQQQKVEAVRQLNEANAALIDYRKEKLADLETEYNQRSNQVVSLTQEREKLQRELAAKDEALASTSLKLSELEKNLAAVESELKRQVTGLSSTNSHLYHRVRELTEQLERRKEFQARWVRFAEQLRIDLDYLYPQINRADEKARAHASHEISLVEAGKHIRPPQDAISLHLAEGERRAILRDILDRLRRHTAPLRSPNYTYEFASTADPSLLGVDPPSKPFDYMPPP